MSDEPFVPPRSKEDVIAMTPITLRFGTKDYKVPILHMTASLAWRRKLVAMLEEVASVWDFTLTNETKMQDLARNWNQQLIQFPDKLAKLVFAYGGKALPRKKIMHEASPEQFAAAMAVIMSVAYPFLGSLAMARRVTRGTTPNLPETMKYTN